MKVLRIKIHQPDAHYRVPFSYQRRFTYPIPPYSTVKGLICNLMGIRDETDKRFSELKRGLLLAIYGKYESIVQEYTWFRNLKKESHINKFNSATNRILDGIPQHPGGQMPVTVDVLHNVNIILYIYHPSLMDEIKSAFENPKQRLSTIHLGRSEDWVFFEEVAEIEPEKQISRHIPYFIWVPSKEYIGAPFVPDNYAGFFNKINGNLFRLPTFYTISENNQRIFSEYVTAKLYEGGSFGKHEFYVDAEERLPVIFTNLGGHGNG